MPIYNLISDIVNADTQKGKDKMNAKEKIVLLSLLKYADKNTGEVKTRLGFIFANPDKMQKSDKFKGYAELSQFYDGDKVFNSIDLSMIGTDVMASFKVISNPTNPLKTRAIIESIEYKGHVINLL